MAAQEDSEYLITVEVTSLEMLDEAKEKLYADVLLVMAWDNNVFKMMKTNGDPKKFEEKVEIIVHFTRENFSDKLKKCPIMLNLSRGCKELGTLKLPIGECITNAILCENFNSQILINEFTFNNEGEDNAIMEVNFRVEKLPDDGISGNLYKSLWKLANPVESEESDKESCKDFSCPGQDPGCCNVGLGQNVYRIINGNLINLNQAIGPCGEKCPVAGKYIKELCSSKPEYIPKSKNYNFNDCQPDCEKLFKKSTSASNLNIATCPKCCKKKKGSQPPMNQPRQRRSDDWIDRNIKEEDLLNKLCAKYGIDVDEVRGIGEKKAKPCTKPKKKKKKKTVTCTQEDCDQLKIDYSKLPPTRKAFVKRMKRRNRGRYSYDFGNEYPLQKSITSIEKGAGDCCIQRVPRYMGWRWDEVMQAPTYKKWFPGKIDKTVRCLMKHLLNPFPLDTLPLTRRDWRGNIMKTCPDLTTTPEFCQKSTLQIQKRDGEISVVMRPLKDNKKLETDCNPYMNCSPLVFKIKKHPEESKKHRAKKVLRKHGFRKQCTCIDLESCRCKTETEKKLLMYEMKEATKEFELKNPLDYNDLLDSSDSEYDVGFTTPAAIFDSRKLKKNVTHCGTQYLIKDIVTTKFKDIEKIIEGDKTISFKKSILKTSAGKKQKPSKAKNAKKTSKPLPTAAKPSSAKKTNSKPSVAKKPVEKAPPKSPKGPTKVCKTCKQT